MQDSLTQSRLAWVTHYVALYKALGGGWNADGGYDPEKTNVSSGY